MIMERSKDYFLEMMMRMFNDPFSKMKEEIMNMYREQEEDDRNSREVESTENLVVIKNKIKTTLRIDFNKAGFPVAMNMESEYEPTEEDARQNLILSKEREKEEAIESEDYIKAAELHKEIESLRKPEVTNK